MAALLKARRASPKKGSKRPVECSAPKWAGEAWARDDGLLLNIPLFQGCSLEFKRLLLREVRSFELEGQGKETWLDPISDSIVTLESLDPERLPQLLLETIGKSYDAGEYISHGGDYDNQLVVVLNGEVEKLVGDAPKGGICVVRRLRRGDCEGLAEFLGVGTDQRTCALRAGEDGCKVRFVARHALRKVLAMPAPRREAVQAKPVYMDEADERKIEEERAPVRFPREVAYFKELALERIDALPHKAARKLLTWKVADEEPFDVLSLEQDVFKVDNALGTSLSGPLPEGIEERFFFNGQTVLKKGVRGDSMIMVLRGELLAHVPPGCGSTCLPRQYLPDDDEDTWLGDGREAQGEDAVYEAPRVTSAKRPLTQGGTSATGRRRVATEVEKLVNQVAMVSLVPPEKMRLATKVLKQAEEAGRLKLSRQASTDWRWAWEDPEALIAIEELQKYKLLGERGEKKAEEVRLHQHPPQPPPPTEPMAVLRSGDVVGKLALTGMSVVLAGVVKARGPVIVAVLHRHVLLRGLEKHAEREFFVPRGVTERAGVECLIKPPAPDWVEERPEHLAPATGPPPRPKAEEIEAKKQPAAGTLAAWRREGGDYFEMAAADALTFAMLNAVKRYNLFWELIHDAVPRLLAALIKQFEPRFLLPGEVVVVDEEPNADFMVVVVHGDFVVTLESAEIERIGQGSVQGASQLLQLNEWTRTLTLDEKFEGEALIQILTREKLLETLSGHPVPKVRLKEIEGNLRFAKTADWRILQQIPAFGSTATKQFLTRVYKDADVRLFCPGDFLAEVHAPRASMLIILAGTLRSEHPQTLFRVELNRGDFCFQNNILGNEASCAHDVVAVTHCMVLVLHRHTLLNAIYACPECRDMVLGNESWRKSSPPLSGLEVLKGVPEPVLSKLEKEAAHRFFRKGSHILRPGANLEEGTLLFITRGAADVLIMGTAIRRLSAGDVIGLHSFLKLPQRFVPSYEIVALEPTDAMLLDSSTLFAAAEDDRYEDGMKAFKQASDVLAGGDILDSFGLKVGGVEAKFVPGCVEESEIFSVCSEAFVAQMPLFVEDLAFFPGEAIYRQQEEGERMFFVQAGRVRMEVLGRAKHEVKDGGATLGDMACMGQVASYTETAVAETQVWVRALHRQLLQRALASFPEEERRLSGAAGRRREGVFDND